MAPEPPAVRLLRQNPRVFWGKVIHVLIARGWNPPPPDERIVEDLLEAMQDWDVAAATLSFDMDEAAAALELLTPTESKVAHMAALGHSNPQIAEALEVTTQTVKFHLSNIYRKLGVENRTQLAASFRR